ncbi:MFS family permease [Lipingzhangella halophila]|uniref:MFS family permease n=1 Tax=Lipingzhangella halophila TaxID=1783352 RepID=A0A7W7W616_9ACTN|nr:MFS transporter [Lipingzhangella halophila]MBB4935266.1 MFS family permease [Lipingzhangella halophila]
MPHPPSPARAAFTLLAATQITLIFALTLVTVPLPAIGRELGVPQSGLIMISAGYGLAFSGLLLFGGRLTDRYGGRRLFLLGLVVFLAASVAGAAAPGFASLVTARFAQGVGAALVAPAAVAVLRASLPDAERYGRAMATWGGLSIIGATAGTLVSGFVATWVSWRWMFLVPVLVALVGLLLARRLLPEAPPAGRAALDLPGGLLATAGISLLSYGILVTEEHSWTAPAVLAPLMTGIVLLCAFVAVEARTRDPLLPLGFLADRERAPALVALALTSAGTALLFVLVVLYLQGVQGWTPMATSMAFLPYAVALLGTGRAAGRLIASFGARRVGAAGLAIAGVGALLLSALEPQSSFATGVLPSMVLLPVGAALSFAATAVLITASAPRRQTGLAGGVMNTAMEFGGSAGLVLFVTVATSRTAHLAADGAAQTIATTSGYAGAFAVSGALYLLWGGVLSIAGRTRATGRSAVH